MISKTIFCSIALSLFFSTASLAETYQVVVEGINYKKPWHISLSKVNKQRVRFDPTYDFEKVGNKYVGVIDTMVSTDEPPRFCRVAIRYGSSRASSGEGANIQLIKKSKVVVGGNEYYDVYFGRLKN